MKFALNTPLERLTTKPTSSRVRVYRLTHFFCASFFCLLVYVLYLTIFVQYPQSSFNPVVYILGRLAQHELGSGSERRGEEY